MIKKAKATVGIAVWLCAALIFSFFNASVPSYAGGNIPVTVDIPLQYVINNQDDMQKAGKNVTVTFTLTAADETTPMPGAKMGGSKSITLTSAGKTSFGPITYERPDVYEYTVVRTTDKEVNGLKIDKTEFKVSVCALSDGNGSIIIKRVGGDGKAELVYADTFKSDSVRTGDETSMVHYINIIFVAMLLLMFVWNAEERRKWEKESRNS